MQEPLSELSRRYREEMLRMYGRNPSRFAEPPQESELSTAQEEIVETPPLPEEYTAPPEAVTEAPEAIAQAPEEMPQTVQLPAEPENNPDFTGNDGDYQDMLETPFPEELEEPVLPDYIRNGTEPVLEEGAAEDLRDLTGEGKIRVAAQTGDGAFPVAGAHVTIAVRRNGRERVAYLLITDESGETPTVSMPAPPASLSQQPGNEQPFTTADIRIFANGYFRAEMRNVPVFAGVTSLQTFQLIPLPILMHEDMETLINESESPDL